MNKWFNWKRMLVLRWGGALCLVMGPLDMKGLLGAATVMGTHVWSGHVWAGRAHFYLHDHELSLPSWWVLHRMLEQNFCLSGPHFSPRYLVWPQRDGRSYVLLDTATTDTLVLDQSFFRPLLWYLKIACVGMLWFSSAWMMMSSCLICTSPERGPCWGYSGGLPWGRYRFRQGRVHHGY